MEMIQELKGVLSHLRAGIAQQATSTQVVQLRETSPVAPEPYDKVIDT